ncbi:MAG: phosphoribosylformylglycinamidine synthase subunit PurQ [Candidatus Binatia bacterium]
MPSAVIIGAGPAGLTATYELSKLGMRATVLEADDQVGGLSRTVNYCGYRFDIGGHRFFSKVPLINELWHEILGEDFLLRPRLSRIHYRGHFFDYPLRPLNALAGLGPVEALLVCLSYAKARFVPTPEETSFEQWVSNRFGYRLYEIFFKTYTEKVWGIPCSEISVDWAAQRIKNLSLSEALRNALLNHQRTKGGEIVTSLIEQFHYPRFGPGMMWERCAELVARAGSPTTGGVRVERLRHRHDRVECVAGRTGSGEVVEFAESGGYVLGICNGFQMLCEAHLLPGALVKNDTLRFACKHVRIRVEQNDTPFTCAYEEGRILRIPIAHSEGGYVADAETLDRLEADGRVVFRYVDAGGVASEAANPNGSARNIAGITNERGNVMGMMPHPERAMESVLGSTDGMGVFESLIRAASPVVLR